MRCPAKKAYLSLLSSPPPLLLSTQAYTPKLTPYTGVDALQIFQSVQTRPRSRSTTSSIGHGRKNSRNGQQIVPPGTGEASFSTGDSPVKRTSSLGRTNSSQSGSHSKSGRSCLSLWSKFDENRSQILILFTSSTFLNTRLSRVVYNQWMSKMVSLASFASTFANSSYLFVYHYARSNCFFSFLLQQVR